MKIPESDTGYYLISNSQVKEIFEFAENLKKELDEKNEYIKKLEAINKSGISI